MTVPVLELKDVWKSWGPAGGEGCRVLQGASLQVHAGEGVAVVGPSGTGKSTLLHLCGLLDRPDRGHVVFEGQKVESMPEAARAALRGRRIGYMYQEHHLLGDLTALENVMVPLLMQGVRESEAVARALVLLQRLGLEPRQKHRPSMLSGGEQQRVSLARALVGNPVLVLADEPTGHLDQGTTRQVFEVMVEQIRRSGAAFVMVTHNLDLAASCQRTLTLDHGRLADYKARNKNGTPSNSTHPPDGEQK